MKIIANINGGFLLEASESEVKDLQRSLGKTNPEPRIGDIIPALDVSQQLRQLRELSECGDMKYLKEHYEKLGKLISKFQSAAERFSVKGGNS